MANKVTTELLLTIYKRAMQYCHAKYGKESYALHIAEDGTFRAIFDWQGGDEDVKYFGAECLSADLDAVYAERKRIEEEKAQQQIAENKRQYKLREQRNKEARKAEYIKLKKEFEK